MDDFNKELSPEEAQKPPSATRKRSGGKRFRGNRIVGGPSARIRAFAGAAALHTHASLPTGQPVNLVDYAQRLS